MEEAVPDRYEKNPMLVLVENYVLDAIGHLAPEKAQRLSEIVCRTFGGNDWRRVIREQFALPADTPGALNKVWRQRQEEADLKQEDYAAEDFARQMADELFADLGS